MVTLGRSFCAHCSSRHSNLFACRSSKGKLKGLGLTQVCSHPYHWVCVDIQIAPKVRYKPQHRSNIGFGAHFFSDDMKLSFSAHMKELCKIVGCKSVIYMPFEQNWQRKGKAFGPLVHLNPRFVIFVSFKRDRVCYSNFVWRRYIASAIDDKFSKKKK